MTEEPKSWPALMTTKEAAEIVGTTSRAIESAIARGELPSRWVNGRRITAVDLKRWLGLA